MINAIHGRVHHTMHQELSIALNGLFFEVHVPNALNFQIGNEVFLHVAFVWREQLGPILYGFESVQDKILFLELCKIKSLGAKTALNILSAPRSLLFTAVMNNDPAPLCEISGIGSKTALRIINEFPREQLAHMTTEPTIYHQVRSILKSLGFDTNAIEKVLPQCSVASIEECVRSALTLLGERKHVTTLANAT
ncbi:MAG: hypothetical protein FJ161_04205 [Gammaproteobacteria bacterium]|nr:hypothetical protein [Gammaproteobacteria bacterium]